MASGVLDRESGANLLMKFGTIISKPSTVNKGDEKPRQKRLL